MPIAKKNDIPQDFLNQMKSNLKKDSSPVMDVQAPVKENSATNVTESLSKGTTAKTEEMTSDGKKEKYADVLNIRLSKGRRNEIKAFCTNNGVTVTQYIESSFEFFAKEVAAGNIVISKGGITKVSQ